jgi:hypothetical protein
MVTLRSITLAAFLALAFAGCSRAQTAALFVPIHTFEFTLTAVCNGVSAQADWRGPTNTGGVGQSNANQYPRGGFWIVGADLNNETNDPNAFAFLGELHPWGDEIVKGYGPGEFRSTFPPGTAMWFPNDGVTSLDIHYQCNLYPVAGAFQTIDISVLYVGCPSDVVSMDPIAALCVAPVAPTSP